jgi:hypothetical protein
MITDYASLQTRVARWVAREGDTSLEDEVPTFIQLGEQQMFLELRVREMICIAQADLNEEYEWLPSGFLEKDHVNILDISDGNLTTGTVTTVTPIDYMDNKEFHRYDRPTGRPEIYTIEGNRIRFKSYPTVDSGEDSGFAFELHYFGSWTPLSDTDTTNTILTTFPQLYLFSALANTEGFLVNDERIALWQSLYSKAVADANRRAELAMTGTLAVGMPS